MAIVDVNSPPRLGVFGPELWVNPETGACCLTSDDGTLLGTWLPDATVNAVFVFVGVVVLAVSEGVDERSCARVADALRRFLELPDLPVVFSAGHGEVAERRIIAVADGAEVSEERMAKAEAFVMVQRELRESPEITVELNRVAHRFSLSFRRVPGGSYEPYLE